MRAMLAGLGLLLLAWVAFLSQRSAERPGADLGQARANDAPAAASAPTREPLAPAAPETSHEPAAEARAVASPPQPPAAAARRDGSAAVTREGDDDDGGLHLRLLDPAGSPLPATAVEVEAVWDGGTASWITRSDRDARVLVVLPRERRPQALRTILLRGRDERKDLGARLAVPPGAVDLGDAVLQPLPVLVSGAVLGPDALRADQPWVEVLSRGADGCALATLRATTAPDGVFEVRGWAEGAVWLDLTARSARTCDARVRVPPGVAGVVLALQSGGVVAGRVLLDHRDHAERLRCALTPVSGEEVSVPLQGQGELMPVRLPPGRYALHLRLAGHPRPLLALEGIEVANGAVAAPPELNPCDLRGRLREITIEARDDLGRWIDARFRFRSAGAGEEAWAGGEHTPGTFGMQLVAVGALDVEASLPGYRTAVLYGVESDAQILLERAHAIALRLNPPPVLPEGCWLEARLQQADGSPAEPPWSQKFEGGCARLSAAVPGTYRAVIELKRSNVQVSATDPDSQRVLADFKRIAAQRITTAPWEESCATLVQPLAVLDTAQEQEFAVQIEQAWIDEALARALRSSHDTRSF